MTLTDLFAYYLGANYEYNEELKRLLIESSLYDFCSSERDIIAFTPNNSKIYLKVIYLNKTRSYFPVESKGNNKYIFDGGNIMVRNPVALETAQELVRKQSVVPLCRRLQNRIMIKFDDISYEACIVNLTCESISLYINSNGRFLYIKYDYETNSFSANFDIDWYKLSETIIDNIYVPDIVNRYIYTNGEKHEFSIKEKNIDIINHDANEEAKKYFYRLR